MATGTVHDIAPTLSLIEGHHPRSLWEDPDLPTIAAYRRGPRLYLLDTGVGPEQRDAIREVAARHRGVSEIVLLNSHGHLDHLGNNDVLAELGVPARHYFPRDARPALDFEAFFGQMYKRGLPYFDYLDGLDLPTDAVASLLRGLGADASLKAEDVAALGARIAALGITPAISPFVPSLVVDILLTTYPPVFPSVETMVDYEDLGPAEEITVGGAVWTGWTFTGDDGEPEVMALQSAGHSTGGLVFYVPEHRFLMLADETSAMPIWADSDPRNTVFTATRALRMLDGGGLDALCAGHRPMLPATGDQAGAVLQGIVDSADAFTAEVEVGLTAHPDGVCIDQLYTELVADADPDSAVALLHRLQFPVFSTFLKLTLLNHCLLLDLPTGSDERGRVTFRLG